MATDGGVYAVAYSSATTKEKLKRRIYGTASAVMRAHGAIGIGRILGVVTPSNIGLIVAESAGWAGPQGSLATVADYSGSVVAMDPEGMFKQASSVRWGGENGAPTALLVNADQLATFNEYAGLCAARGVLRAAFVCPEQAMRWAEQQAVVQSYWRQRQCALQSHP